MVRPCAKFQHEESAKGDTGDWEDFGGCGCCMVVLVFSVVRRETGRGVVMELGFGDVRDIKCSWNEDVDFTNPPRGFW